MNLAEAKLRAAAQQQVEDDCYTCVEIPATTSVAEKAGDEFSGDDELEEDLGIALDMLETTSKFLTRLIKQREITPKDWRQMRTVRSDLLWFTTQFDDHHEEDEESEV